MKRLMIEGNLHDAPGEGYRHFFRMLEPETGGINPLAGAGQIMIWGVRDDVGGEARWYHYPIVNVLSYAVYDTKTGNERLRKFPRRD